MNTRQSNRRPVRSRIYQILAGILVVILGWVSTNPAKAEIVFGTPDTVFRTRFCPLIGAQTKATISATAGFDTRGNSDDFYKVGEIFYVTVSIANPSTGTCLGNLDVLPTFYLPSGLEFAVTPERPALWGYVTDPNAAVQLEPAYTEPSTFPATGGLTIAHPIGDGNGEPWPVADAFLIVRVPVVARERLVGIGGGALVCAQREAGSVCPPEYSGDFLQVYVATNDTGGYSRPFVGVFVADADPIPRGNKGGGGNGGGVTADPRNTAAPTATVSDGRLLLTTGYAAGTRVIVKIAVTGKRKTRAVRLKVRGGAEPLTFRLSVRERAALAQGNLSISVKPKGSAETLAVVIQ